MLLVYMLAVAGIVAAVIICGKIANALSCHEYGLAFTGVVALVGFAYLVTNFGADLMQQIHDNAAPNRPVSSETRTS